ncbi:hypothetical protein GCM10028815_30790 [Mariniluteicoccus flavus]
MHGEWCGLRDGGCFQKFEGGSIYWKASTGAHFIRGRIFAAAWGGQGWENGGLGYPTSDEICGLRDNGCVQRFEGGLGYWSFATDAHAVWGAIGQRYAQMGWENSPLGYPTTGELCGLRDRGCVQQFQGGLVYFSPNAGTYPVWGAIRGAYAGGGWENSPLGYPTSSEFCGLRDGGCGQRFQGGLILWSARSGAHPVRGAILGAYAAQGHERGGLGYPTSAEGRVEGTTITQIFQGGKLVFHTDTMRVDNGEVALTGERCIASHYYEPQPTASGEWFDPSTLTAAHKTLPLHSYARVTNVDNGRSVVVRINDRGPYVAGRCIDLSTASFSAIGDTSRGLISVAVQPL